MFVMIEVHCIKSTPIYMLCRSRIGRKGIDAEDGMWQNIDLAEINKISTAVAKECGELSKN